MIFTIEHAYLVSKDSVSQLKISWNNMNIPSTCQFNATLPPWPSG